MLGALLSPLERLQPATPVLLVGSLRCPKGSFPVPSHICARHKGNICLRWDVISRFIEVPFYYSAIWSSLSEAVSRKGDCSLPSAPISSCYVRSVISADPALSGNFSRAVAGVSGVRHIAPQGSEGELGCTLSVGARALWEGQQLQQKFCRGQ